ncbi:hypothetical protein HAX54_043279, partial [Datura stramonium]|nr:hypothetical protein [Datura stramonium]
SHKWFKNVHVIFDEQKEVNRVSTHEEIKEIGMASTMNSEGELGIQDEGTQYECQDTFRTLNEQCITSNEVLCNNAEEIDLMTTQNPQEERTSLSDEEDLQETQTGNWKHKSSHPALNMLSPLDS